MKERLFKFYKKLRILLCLHEWEYFTVNPEVLQDPATFYSYKSRRECAKCGRVQEFDKADGGFLTIYDD